MRRRAAFVLPVCTALAACGGTASHVPGEVAVRTISAFKAGIAACAGRVSDAGVIDEAGLTAAGWQVGFRRAGGRVDDRQSDVVGSPPFALQAADEEELSSWRHADHRTQLDLLRYPDGGTPPRAGVCEMKSRVAGLEDVAAVVEQIGAAIGRPYDQQGFTKQPGSRSPFDATAPIYRWELPRADVYLHTNADAYLYLAVVAQPDRGPATRFLADEPSDIMVMPGANP